jgi:flagellar protein FliO/FliZ
MRGCATLFSQTYFRILGTLLIILIVNLMVHQSVFAAEEKDNTVWGMLNDPVDQSTNQGESGDESSNEEESAEATKPDNAFLLLLKLVFYTLIVVVLIYALVKFLAVRQRKMQHNQVFQSLGGTPLGTNKSLQLVKVGGKIYLLGVADQISLIKEITDSEETAIIEKDLKEQDSIMSKNFLELFKSKEKQGDQRGSTTSFQDLFNRSLQQQKQHLEKMEHQLVSRNTDEKEGRSM